MPVSPNATYVTGPGASITDAYGTVYAINVNGQITIDGKVDTTTNRVDALGVFNGEVWQKNGDNLWYSKSSASARWVDFPASGGNPMPVPVYITTQTIGVSGLQTGLPLVDSHGNVWRINAQGQVEIDGRADLTTRHVVQMEFVNGKIWQENTDGDWYSKTKPSDHWSAAERGDPIQAAHAEAEYWIGGGFSGTDPRLAANWSGGHLPTPGSDLIMTQGTMNLGGGKLGGNTLHVRDTGEWGSINLTNGGELHLADENTSGAIVVNMTGGGRAALHVETGYPGSEEVVVNIDARSTIMLDAQMTFGQLTERGGTLLLNGDNHFVSAAVMLDTSITGFGTIYDQTAPRIGTSSMEITGAVGSGVKIAVIGTDFAYPRVASLVLDNAAADKGAVTLEHGSLLLKGVGVVDSMSYKNAILSLFHGDTVVDSYRVAGVANTQPGNVSSGVLNFTYAAGNLTVYDGGAATKVSGLTMHA